jgi:hypothetical protein
MGKKKENKKDSSVGARGCAVDIEANATSTGESKSISSEAFQYLFPMASKRKRRMFEGPKYKSKCKTEGIEVSGHLKDAGIEISLFTTPENWLKMQQRYHANPALFAQEFDAFFLRQIT